MVFGPGSGRVMWCYVCVMLTNVFLESLHTVTIRRMIRACLSSSALSPTLYLSTSSLQFLAYYSVLVIHLHP